ncbi:MAG: hypothetical protein J6J15_06285 [Oscillospiraceae bacterium]|nr:hypothetical protein [Oscillospiraceae bacterium]
MKKIISFLLALIMINTFAVTGFAEDGAKITASSAEYVLGDENKIVEITFSLDENPGFASFNLYLVYDDTKLTLKEIVSGSVLTGMLGANNPANNAVGAIGFTNNVGTGSLFTAKFEVNTDTVGKYDITLGKGNNGSFANASGVQVPFTVVPGSVTVVCAEHNYINVEDEKYVVTPATCTVPGVYYVSCSACGIKGGTTFVGNTIPHTFDKQEATDEYKASDATCSVPAAYYFSCSVCGEKGTETFNTEVDAEAHAWDDGEITTVPTCMEEGVRTYICQNNTEHTKTEAVEIDENNHTGVNHIEGYVAPTCGTEGYTGDTYCECGEKVADGEAIPATGEHVYENEKERVEPTCDEDGYVIMACGCGVEAEKEILPKYGHTWSDFEYNWNWIEDGEYSRYECTAIRFCTVETCGVEEARTTSAGKGETTPATCSAEGKTVYTAKFADDWAETQTKTVIIEIDPEAHAWNKGEVTTEPTCVAEGVRTYTCQHNTEHTKTESIAKDENKHTGNNELVNEKAPTCAEDGYSGDTYCECGALIEKGEVIKATGDHVYAIEKEKVEPTCDEDGYVIMACGCGAEAEKEVLPKLGHTWGPVEYIWADGNDSCVAVRECTVEECDGKEEAIGNVSDSTTDATCSAEGKTVYTAEFVNDWAETQTKTVAIAINPEAHAWNKGEVTTEPTCSAMGVKTYTCQHNAEHTKTEDIAINPDAHAWSVSYNWSDDGLACTATRVCANNAEHNIVVDATVTGVKTKEPTCSAMGDTQYTAKFAADWAETQVTVRTDVPVDDTKHDWDAWKVTEYPTYGVAGKETRVCVINPEHKEYHELDALEMPKQEEADKVVIDEKEYFVGEEVIAPEETKDVPKEIVDETKLNKKKYNVSFVGVIIGAFDDAGEFTKEDVKGTVTIGFPEGADKNDKFEVYVIDAQGNVTKLAGADVTEAGIEVEVDGSATFAIAYESVSNHSGRPVRPSTGSGSGSADKDAEENPNTGAPFMGYVPVMVVAAAVAICKKRH